MNEQKVREIVRDEAQEEIREMRRELDNVLFEFDRLQASDRYTFQKALELLDGNDIEVGTNDGTKIGTSSTEKLGLWGVTPVDQPETVSDPSTSSVSGTGDDATINNNFAALVNTVSAIIDRLQESGNIK